MLIQLRVIQNLLGAEVCVFCMSHCYVVRQTLHRKSTILLVVAPCTWERDPMLWMNTRISPPSSWLKSKSGKKATKAGPDAGLLLSVPSFSCLSKLIIRAICFSETSSCLRATRRYMSEDHTYTSYRRDTLSGSTVRGQTIGECCALPSWVTWPARSDPSAVLRCCISYWFCIAKDVLERLRMRNEVMLSCATKNKSRRGGNPCPRFWMQNARSIMLSVCLRWQYRRGLGGVSRSIRPVWPRWPSDMILVIFRCSPYTPFPPPRPRPDSCVIRSFDVTLRVEVLCLVIGGLLVPVKLLSVAISLCSAWSSVQDCGN
jgi:hypothetical protein